MKKNKIFKILLVVLSIFIITGCTTTLKDPKTKKVVTKALFDSYHNFAVSTPGIICTLHRIICKIIPSSILMKGWNIIRKL